MILVSLIVILNVPCGLIRVNGDGLSPDLKDGDLVVVSKNDGVFMTNDVVLMSLEKCSSRSARSLPARQLRSPRSF